MNRRKVLSFLGLGLLAPIGRVFGKTDNNKESFLNSHIVYFSYLDSPWKPHINIQVEKTDKTLYLQHCTYQKNYRPTKILY